jgi:hypothetical protein
MLAAALVILPSALAGSGARAQSDAAQPAPAPRHRLHHHARAAAHAETPIDKGPDTPEANAAYQGGGVILQGAPGAPAPRPQATPPGMVPANSVPPS